MKVVVPVNNKGGVGKTKVSILLAEYFSLVLKKRVLSIDFDPQCNFSRRFLKMEDDPVAPEGVIPPIHPNYYDPEGDENNSWDGRTSIAEIFFGGVLYPYSTPIPNLDIMPGHADKLLEAERVRRSEVLDKVHNQLALFINDPGVQEEYDIIIIDTAPSKGPLTVAAVKAASHILIPCVMEEQPIQGVYGMLQLWMQESYRRDLKRPLELIGILPNMFRQTTLHKDMLKSLKENTGTSEYVMPVQLGLRTVFAEVDAEGAIPKTIFDLPDRNEAKKEAIEVCEYISKRIFGHD